MLEISKTLQREFNNWIGETELTFIKKLRKLTAKNICRAFDALIENIIYEEILMQIQVNSELKCFN